MRQSQIRITPVHLMRFDWVGIKTRLLREYPDDLGKMQNFWLLHSISWTHSGNHIICLYFRWVSQIFFRNSEVISSYKLDFESYITNVILFRYDFNNNRYFSLADFQLKFFLLWSNRWTICFNFFYKNIKLIIILHPKEKLKSFFSEFIFFDVISACVCSFQHYFLLI